MPNQPDWRISSLLRESCEQFEQHAKRIESILDAAREKFEKDFSSTTAGTGLTLLVASVALAVIGKAVTVSTAGVVGGVVLIVAALFVRHRTGESQLEHARTLVDLERERARFAQKSAILQHIWLYGLPEGTPLAQIQILLGETDFTTNNENGQPLRWRALPASTPAQSESPLSSGSAVESDQETGSD